MNFRGLSARKQSGQSVRLLVWRRQYYNSNTQDVLLVTGAPVITSVTIERVC